MGSRNIPHLYIYKIKTMKILKKIISESLVVDKKNVQTFSTKKQNIVLTEQQLEILLIKLNKK